MGSGVAIPMAVTYTNTYTKEPEQHGWPSPPDPGDLSKRVQRRREELHLSREQVAARTGISLRYLEYLERYPARPSAADLRQLAAVLCTTPAALLGAGAQVPPGQFRLERPPVMERLTSVECRRLITPGGIGRIAFSTSAGPVALPVNFAVVSETYVVRTGEGGLIEGHADGPVALEVDRIDEALRQGWSVLVRGQAHRVCHRAELSRLRRDAAIWPWPGGDRDVYVRILPGTITGRRLVAP